MSWGRQLSEEEKLRGEIEKWGGVVRFLEEEKERVEREWVCEVSFLFLFLLIGGLWER